MRRSERSARRRRPSSLAQLPLEEVQNRVRVFTRIRPLVDRRATLSYRIAAPPLPSPSSAVTAVVSSVASEVTFDVAGAARAVGSVNNNARTQTFRFDGVLPPSATQEQLFDVAARDVVQAALDGYNGTIFAFGQTGSGKTHALTGGDSFSDRGIIPRAIAMIFSAIERRRQREESAGLPHSVTKVYMSYLEIYNENIYDLLDREHRDRPLSEWPKIGYLEDAWGDLHLLNLNTFEVTSEAEALKVLFLGNFHRVVSETPMNMASSRSHCILSTTIDVRSADGAEVCISKLHMVDLAGSERVYKRETHATTRREGCCINLSLHYLEQVIIALNAQRQREERGGGGGGGGSGSGSAAHIPFRNSTLTTVLRNSLGGNCRTAFVVTLNPEAEFVDESISSCRFACRCAALRSAVSKNKHLDPRAELRVCQRENELLREALKRREAEFKRLAALLNTARRAASSTSTSRRPAQRGAGPSAGPSSSSEALPSSGALTLSATQRRSCEQAVITYLTGPESGKPPTPSTLESARGMMALLRHHALHAARMAATEKRKVARLEAEVERLRA